MRLCVVRVGKCQVRRREGRLRSGLGLVSPLENTVNNLPSHSGEFIGWLF